MSKKLIIASIVLSVVFAPFANAETPSTTESAKPRHLKEKIMVAQESREAIITERKEKHGELQKLHQDKILSLRAEFQAKREEFATKLQELKDQRKKLIIERVDKRLTTINQNWAERMNASIVKLETLLKKFSDRATALKVEGKDTTAVDLAVTDAETAIQTAKDAVATQEAKEYVADLSDEEKLKTTVGESMSNLRKDLKQVHDLVKIAKQKVIDVARALAKITPSSDLPSPEPTQIITPSATPAPGI